MKTIPIGMDPKVALQESIQMLSAELDEEKFTLVGKCVVRVGVHDCPANGNTEFGKILIARLCTDPSLEQLITDCSEGHCSGHGVKLNSKLGHSAPPKAVAGVGCAQDPSSSAIIVSFRGLAVDDVCQGGSDALATPTVPDSHPQGYAHSSGRER